MFQIDLSKNIPWKLILTNVNVYACCILMACTDFMYTLLLTVVPSYLSYVLALDVHTSGIYSGLPHLMCTIFRYVTIQRNNPPPPKKKPQPPTPTPNPTPPPRHYTCTKYIFVTFVYFGFIFSRRFYQKKSPTITVTRFFSRQTFLFLSENIQKTEGGTLR